MTSYSGISGSRTPKRFFAGTHRSHHPGETWERLTSLLPAFGITRIADITGLDRIGIPVATAIRPLSRSIAVAAGKGVDLIAAKVSAAMEGIECAHAEWIDRPLVFACREEILRNRRTLEFGRLTLLAGHQLHDGSRMLWIEGRELADDAAVMLPYELVHAHYAPPGLPASKAFLATTNGLASGNSIAEATCHGLFEVVERDALNLWSRLPPARQHQDLLDIESVSDPVAGNAIERLTHAGFEIAVWDITSDFAIPAIHCLIIDIADPEGHPGTGTGCHPDKNIALARALFEAVQVRATYISGGRDDLWRREYEAGHMQAFRRTLTNSRHQAGRIRRPFHQLPSKLNEFFEDDLEWAADNLAKAGARSIIVVDLSQQGTGLAVVRVLVPGLEGPLSESAEPGERARRIVQ